VNVTPFNSANGIFIELTFSSGVISSNPPIAFICHTRACPPHLTNLTDGLDAIVAALWASSSPS